MLGTILNVGGILVGGVAGLTVARTLSIRSQQRLRNGLAALVVYAGFSMVCGGLQAPFRHAVGQLAYVALLALSLGSFTGWMLRLQRGMNWFGRQAKDRFSRASSTVAAAQRADPSEGFITCTLLFCVGPMAILGSVQDGIDGEWRTLALKGAMDGLATMGFVATFGWSPLLAAIPVLAYQGTLTLAARMVEPLLRDQALKDSLNVTGGVIVACIALIVLDLRKIPLANYLPALAYAPLFTHLLG